MKPTQQTPNLEINLINDTTWSLDKQHPEKYTLVIFYRGLHCPVCKKQLENVTKHLDELEERGINVIAVSMDSEKRAKKAGASWNVEKLPIGYGLKREAAEQWGLYFSKGISDKEPDLFSEPGMFLIKADGTLYFSSVQTMPFTRPRIDAVIKAVDFVEEKNYPARGED
ncbi:peroxiredoxin-like family protein [Nonlabens sp. Asnod2-A12]|uniref:peroxiredoxin-like family protein n=1 Tax=Nonlabens sp. Asnod2-A12 TaxID=3160578 RepID=UPI00386D9BBF